MFRSEARPGAPGGRHCPPWPVTHCSPPSPFGCTDPDPHTCVGSRTQFPLPGWRPGLRHPRPALGPSVHHQLTSVRLSCSRPKVWETLPPLRRSWVVRMGSRLAPTPPCGVRGHGDRVCMCGGATIRVCVSSRKGYMCCLFLLV